MSMKDELVLLARHLNSGREELRDILWQVTSMIVERSSVRPHQDTDSRRGAA